MRRNLLMITITTSLLASGCATFKSDEFSCNGHAIYKNGICMNAKSAYEAAEKGKDANDFVSVRATPKKSKSFNPRAKYPRHDEDVTEQEHISGQDTPQRLADVAPVIAPMRTPLAQPKPLLMPATVAEIWVNAFENDRGALHMPSVVFIEVTPRRWSLDATNIETYEASGPFTVVKSAKPVTTSSQQHQLSQ